MTHRNSIAVLQLRDSPEGNPFYQNLYDAGIKSIILIPIRATKNGDLALLEIASPRAYDLNSVNINKLKDIIPVFEAAVKRTSEERQNVLEATFQQIWKKLHKASTTQKWIYEKLKFKEFYDPKSFFSYRYSKI